MSALPNESWDPVGMLLLGPSVRWDERVTKNRDLTNATIVSDIEGVRFGGLWLESTELITILAWSYWAVPVLMIAPIFLTRLTTDRSNGALSSGDVWLGLCLYASILSLFGARIKWGEIAWFQQAYDFVVFPISLIIFLLLIVYANFYLRAMRPAWLRPIAGVSFLSMICMAFGGIAERVDGDQGMFDIFQYGFEFYLRALDLFSFGTLSNYYPKILNEGISYTAQSSVTVTVFNIVMSLCGFNIVLQLFTGMFSKRIGSQE